MGKIEKLTPGQIARFPEFVKRWTEIGLSTQPADRLQAEHGIRLAYESANLKLPRKIVWCGSPLSQGLTRAVLQSKNFEMGKKASVRDSVRASVGDSVGASVWASVRDSVGASVRDSVRASVGDSVWASVWDSVRASVGDSVGASVWASVGDSVWDSGYGQHDANWLAFYEFFSEVCGLTKQTDTLQGLWLHARAAGWYLPHQHICWIAERHLTLCRNGQGQLHCDSGPAVAYPDGWEIYALNGVRVPQELVVAKADALDVTRWCTTKEGNAEIRREAVRKIGIERVCVALGSKTIDKRGDYELIVFDIGDGRKRPHLKMLNPSIGVYHIEGVAPHIRTVQQAINWRAGDEQSNWVPEVLT